MAVGLLYDSLEQAIEAYSEAMKCAGEQRPEPQGAPAESSILEAYEQTGSIAQTAQDLGRSYRTVRRVLASVGKINAEQLVEGIDVATVSTLLRQGTKYSEIARRCNVTIPSIADVVAIVPGLKDDLALLRQDALASGNRQWLRETLQEHPSITRAGLSKLNHRRYRWLVRNDKEWLESNAPVAKRGGWKKGQKSKKHKNWALVEDKYIVAIGRATEKLQGLEIPIHLSKYAILAEARLSSVLDRCQGKVPRAVAKLEECAESREAFRKRRIRWAFKKVMEAGEVMSIKALSRMSGLDGAVVRSFWGEISLLDRIHHPVWDPRSGVPFVQFREAA